MSLNLNTEMNFKIFAANIKKRRLIFFMICITLSIAFPIGFLIFTINDTLAIQNLDRQSYNSRMSDSILFSIGIFAAALIIFGPIMMVLNKMFNSYLWFIKTLSGQDTKKLFLLNNHEPFYYKYMPPYIIKENTVTFFPMFSQNTIRFEEVISIDVKQRFGNGYAAIVKIETTSGNYNYTLSGNSFSTRNLLSEALAANPKIIKSENWNG